MVSSSHRLLVWGALWYAVMNASIFSECRKGEAVLRDDPQLDSDSLSQMPILRQPVRTALACSSCCDSTSGSQTPDSISPFPDEPPGDHSWVRSTENLLRRLSLSGHVIRFIVDQFRRIYWRGWSRRSYRGRAVQGRTRRPTLEIAHKVEVYNHLEVRLEMARMLLEFLFPKLIQTDDTLAAALRLVQASRQFVSHTYELQVAE